MRWPRITLVTPSLNQGRFLETAIRSVLNQRYPNLEYFVIDGGSRDGTRQVLRRYRSRLTRVVSRRDGGQAAALQQGLQWATGEIFHWLNADDRLIPGALRRVARAFSGMDAVAGGFIHFSPKEKWEKRSAALSAPNLIRGVAGTSFHQPALWLRRESVLACGGIDAQFYFAFDWDLAVRYLHQFPHVRYVDAPLIRFRLHPASKTATVGSLFPAERMRILKKLLSDEAYLSLHGPCRERLALETWWMKLGNLMSDRPLSRTDRAFAILRAAIKDPPSRFSRMTAGALRRTLMGLVSGTALIP